MWPWRTDPALHLWVGFGHWRLQARAEVLASGTMACTSVTELAAAIQAIDLADAARGHALEVILDDRWCRSFLVHPPPNATSAADLGLCAQVRMSALFGEGGMAWTTLTDLRANEPFVACALPEAARDALFALAKACGASVHAIAPLWAHLCCQKGDTASPRWLVVQAGGTTTLVRLAPQGVSHVRTLISAMPLDPDEIRHWWRLEALRAGVACSEVQPGVEIIGPDLQPSHRAVHGRRRRRRAVAGLARLNFAASNGVWRWPGWSASWPIAAAAVILAVAGLWSWVDVVDKGQVAISLQDQARQIASSGLPVQANADAPASLAMAGLSSGVASTIVRRLNTPWPDYFNAIEQATDPGVDLLRMALDAQRSQLRATALADDEAAMFRYVRQLHSRQVLAHARVTRHEAVESTPGQAVQFSFEADLFRADAAGRSPP